MSPVSAWLSSAWLKSIPTRPLVALGLFSPHMKLLFHDVSRADKNLQILQCTGGICVTAKLLAVQFPGFVSLESFQTQRTLSKQEPLWQKNQGSTGRWRGPVPSATNGPVTPQFPLTGSKKQGRRKERNSHLTSESTVRKCDGKIHTLSVLPKSWCCPEVTKRCKDLGKLAETFCFHVHCREGEV